MELFDYSKLNQEREEEVKKIPAEVLEEPINPEFPEGVEEMAALLTFIPEEQRLSAIQGFIGATLVT